MAFESGFFFQRVFLCRGSSLSEEEGDGGEEHKGRFPSARLGPGAVLATSPVRSLTGSSRSGGTGSVKSRLTGWGPGSATYSCDSGQVISCSWQLTLLELLYLLGRGQGLVLFVCLFVYDPHSILIRDCYCYFEDI